jgi:hypothetical protein
LTEAIDKKIQDDIHWDDFGYGKAVEGNNISVVERTEEAAAAADRISFAEEQTPIHR